MYREIRCPNCKLKKMVWTESMEVKIKRSLRITTISKCKKCGEVFIVE